MKATSTNVRSSNDSTQTGESHHSRSNQDKQRDQKSPSSASSRLSSKSVAIHNAGRDQSSHRLMQPPPPNLPAKSGHEKKNRQPDALTFSKIQTPTRSAPHIIPDADSFDFHSVVNQHRAGHQQSVSITPLKSRQTDKRDSKKRLSEVPESNRPAAFNRLGRSKSVRFDNDDPFVFGPMQAGSHQNVHTPTAFLDATDTFFENRSHRNLNTTQASGWKATTNLDDHFDSFDAALQPYNHFQSSGHVSVEKRAGNSFELNLSSRHRPRSATVHKTRIIRSSLSRAGESAFIQELVIQTIKQKF